MKDGLELSNEEMHRVFATYNQGKLNSFVIEITSDILAHKNADGEHVVDTILDTAGQKGTGKWTGISALDLGIHVALIGEAVFARCLSAIKEERVKAARFYATSTTSFSGDKEQFIADLEDAMYASKLISYAQRFMLMRAAAKEYCWELNNGKIVMMWRGGCIIRSSFLGNIRDAFTKHPNLETILLDDYFKDHLEAAEGVWRRVLSTAIQLGIPAPSMTSALSFYDGYRCSRLPANLLQAQRDYFSAHTYERVDKPRGNFFHTKWS